MKNLVNYIKESSNNIKSVPEDTTKAVSTVMKACRKLYNKFIDTKKAGLQNAKMIVDYITDNKLVPEYRFVTTKDYYEQYYDADSNYNPTDKKFRNKYGDIIVMDDTDTECAYIKLKIGKTDYPEVNYGELHNFEEAGIFVFVNNKGTVKGIPAVKIKDYLKEHPETLETTGSGQTVAGVIGKYSSDDYISGKLIASI